MHVADGVLQDRESELGTWKRSTKIEYDVELGRERKVKWEFSTQSISDVIPSQALHDEFERQVLLLEAREKDYRLKLNQV